MTASLSPAGGTESPALPSEITACWGEIGVYGDGSCARLSECVHCRNCPIYSAAALQLLERPMPAEYRREWTRHFAGEEKRPTPGRLSALLFRIEAEWLALPTQAFQEVAERRQIHSLPHRRDGLALGIVNIRGEILTCAALGRMLGLEQSRRGGAKHYDRLLVVNWEDQRLAFPVDEVHGIERFQVKELRLPPATVVKSTEFYSQGILNWHRRSVGYLDAAALFRALNRSLA